jgi:hypothetical protein
VIRRLFSVTLYIVAGFFLYGMCLLAFVSGAALDADASSAAKWLPMGIFAVPAVLALGAGLAVARQNWRRDAGIVFLFAAGFSTFLIFTFGCMLLNEEFRKMMPPEILTFFSDYITGAAVIVVLAVVGALLLMASRGRRRTTHEPDAPSHVGDA